MSKGTPLQKKNKIYSIDYKMIRQDTNNPQNALYNNLEKNVKYTTKVVMPYGNRPPYETSLNNFIRYVKNNKKGYSIYYTDEDYVKPFFDVDLKTNENINSESFLNNCLKLLNETFKKSNISIASNHRYIKKDNKYKYSFHIIVNGYYTKTPYLKSLVNSYQEKMKILYGDECFDKKVYRTKNILRFSNQYKWNKKEIEVTENPPIIEKGSLIDFVITNVHESKDKLFTCELLKSEENIISSNSKNKTTEYQSLEELEYDYYVNESHKKQIKKLIKDDPKKYIEDYEKWLFFTSFCKTINDKDLWIECSKLSDKFNEEDNMNTWNSVIKYKGYVEYFMNEINVSQKYYKYKNILKNEIKYNTEINKQKLGYEFITEKYFNNNELKCLLIKSDTGTGKTTSFKHFIKTLKEKYYCPILSIVSRISMADELHRIFNDFKIESKHYNDTFMFNNGENCITTLESLYKTKRLKLDEYILFIDEIESVLLHLIDSPTIRNRYEVFSYLIYIIQNCKFMVGCDADISNTITVNFIKSILNDEHVQVINNTYKHNKDVKSYEYNDIEKLIEDIKKSEKYIVCFDSLDECKKIYQDIQDDSIKIFSSETTDKIELDKYEKIFMTPKVIYGLDSQIKRNVFCIYTEKTINPNQMIQQIARTRNIIDIKYYFKNKNDKVSKIFFKNYNECNNYYQSLLNYCNDKELKDHEKIYIEEHFKFSIMTKQIDTNIKLYDDLYRKIKYNENCYRVNKYLHFKLLLKKRGIVDIDNTEKIIKIKIQLEEQEKDPKKVFDEKKLDKYFDLTNVDKELFIEKFKDIIIDDKLLINHFNIRKWFINILKDGSIDMSKLNDTMSKKNEYIIKQTNQNNIKLQFLNDMLKCTDSKDNLNPSKVLDLESSDKMSDIYEKMFRIRKKKKCDFTKMNEITSCFKKIYTDLFNKDGLINCERKTDKKICKNKYLEFSINEDKMIYHKIMIYPNNISLQLLN
jgi:hypothetical protein